MLVGGAALIATATMVLSRLLAPLGRSAHPDRALALDDRRRRGPAADRRFAVPCRRCRRRARWPAAGRLGGATRSGRRGSSPPIRSAPRSRSSSAATARPIDLAVPDDGRLLEPARRRAARARRLRRRRADRWPCPSSCAGRRRRRSGSCSSACAATRPTSSPGRRASSRPTSLGRTPFLYAFGVAALANLVFWACLIHLLSIYPVRAAWLARRPDRVRLIYAAPFARPRRSGRRCRRCGGLGPRLVRPARDAARR